MPGDEPAPARPSGRSWLGVELRPNESGQGGVLVSSVVRGSPAAAAGLLKGDVLLKVKGRTVNSPRAVIEQVSRAAPGDRLPVVLRRGTSERILAVKVRAMPSREGVLRMAYVGAKAPALQQLQSAQGSPATSWSGYRGKVVVLEFWATWCQVCSMLVPTLNDWQHKFSGQGVEFLGVSAESVPTIVGRAPQLGIEYPLASDHTAKTTQAYRASALPTVFVVDKKGVIRDMMIGYDEAQLAKLERLVARLRDAP